MNCKIVGLRVGLDKDDFACGQSRMEVEENLIVIWSETFPSIFGILFYGDFLGLVTLILTLNCFFIENVQALTNYQRIEISDEIR